MLKDNTEAVDAGRIDVEGCWMRGIIEISIGKEKKGRESGVNVWGRGFVGSCVLVGASRRPWIVGGGCCGEIAGVAVRDGEIEVPYWGGKRNRNCAMLGKGADFEFIVTLPVVCPKDLSGSVRLDDNVVTDGEFDGDGADALVDA